MRKFHNGQMYEEREMRMVEEFVHSIKGALVDGGIQDAALKTLTENIAFSVTSIVDGSTHMPLNEDHLVPILGFAEGRMRDRLLVPLEGGSSLHGLVPGYIDDAFKA